MKLLYLVEWDAFTNSGVLRKIKAQYRAWLKLGVDAKLVIVSPEGSGAPLIAGEGISVFTHRQGRFGVGKFFKAKALRNAGRLIGCFEPDVIYYRQSSWTPGILGVLRGAKCVVAEINSNDVYEIGQYGWLRAHYHLATRDWLLNLVSGFVCVGREIGEFYRQYKKPVQVVPNGFDTSSVSPRPIPSIKRPNLVFVGSAGQAWHGVDKILEIAKCIPEFDFHIVGDSFPVELPNVKCYGHVGWETLDKIYRNMSVGIASLALHRINVGEISPLKTREYLAYGLPVIAAYEDPDLDGCDYVLRIPNTESGVRDSVEEIREFVAHWNGREINHDDVKVRIDSNVKEKVRIDFMMSVLSKQL